MSSYLHAVYATIDRAPTKKGKKRRAMKIVCIWAALPARRGGWQFWVRLTWGGDLKHTREQRHVTQTPFSLIIVVIHCIILLKFTKLWAHFSLKHYLFHSIIENVKIRALNSIASKVIQRVHETLNNTRSSLGQITHRIESIYFSGIDWPCLVQCNQKVYFINSKPCPSFP